MVNTALLSAWLAVHASQSSPSSSGSDLAVRQSPSNSKLDPSQFPSQCQSNCTTIINSLNSCTTDSCICTSDNANGMSSCVNCLISTAPDSNSLKTEGQSLLDQFNTECSTFNLPTLSIGGSPSTIPASTGSASTPTKPSTSHTSSTSTTSASGLTTGNNASHMQGGFAGLAVSLGIIAVAALML